MQTRFIILSSIFGLISALSFSTNQNILLSIITALIAAAFGLAAYFAKDKKDNQIEEIHSEIINNSQNKPTETSTSITESYMETAHKAEIDAYKNNVIALNRNLASRGIYSSGMAVMQIKDLKLTHIKTFVNNCIEYIETTKNNYLLDKTAVKFLLENYQNTDSNEIAEIIKSQYIARGLNIRQDIVPSVVSDINNTYNIALLHIDAM
jgi:hypothetical protein